MSANAARTILAALGGLLFFVPFASADGFGSMHAPTTAAADQERYYVVFFAHQSAKNEIKLSHTFATFVRTTGESPHLNVEETATISWLPASGKISLGRFAETGVNLSLEATLARAEERQLQITIGPFEIRRELFQRAAQQAARLNRGELKYKVFDGNSRSTAKNCIHALADIVHEHGLLQSGTTRGQEATLLVARHFEPFYVSGQVATNEASLFDALGLQRFAEPTTTTLATRGQR